MRWNEKKLLWMCLVLIWGWRRWQRNWFLIRANWMMEVTKQLLVSSLSLGDALWLLQGSLLLVFLLVYSSLVSLLSLLWLFWQPFVSLCHCYLSCTCDVINKFHVLRFRPVLIQSLDNDFFLIIYSNNWLKWIIRIMN